MEVPTHFEPLPPGLSLDQKWDSLKPKIEELYVDQGLTLRKVSELLKAKYNFDANESQYKYRINKIWRFNKKNIPASKKTTINNRVSSQVAGSSIGVVKYKGRVVDERKLRRQARTDLKRSRPTSQHQADRTYDCNLSAFAGKIFMRWSVPYMPSKAPSIEIGNHISPFPPLGSTPSDVSFGSPETGQLEARVCPISSYNSALQKKTSIDRAWLFLNGKLPNIIGSMTHEEQMTMSTWLYQIWFFSFKTSKYWGRGPRYWTADYLDFRKNEAANFPTPASQDSPAVVSPLLAQPTSPAAGDLRAPTAVHPPSQLCKWSIHVQQVPYQRIPDPPDDMEGPIDVGDPTTYKPWSLSELSNASFPNTLRDALESNDFSSIRNDQLPVAVPQVLQKAVRHEEDLVHESLAFAIMSRNVEMLAYLLYSKRRRGNNVVNELFKAISAFHLAAAYLDGAKSCCMIMNLISEFAPLRMHYINSLGHTVLDALMITIIKSHTSCKPEIVDDVFRGSKRFPGEEIDICGRWDADSDCVRTLLLQGKHRVPFHWKHKFCHTSAQAVCDTITTIWGCESAPNINTKSGLFIRRCSHCGLKMQLSPLHTFVLVMFHLSTHGREGEDLFGIVATLLCLLRNGADPSIQSAICIASLLQSDDFFYAELDANGCQHEDLDPLHFARKILQQSRLHFTPEIVLGWEICIEVLLHAESGQEASDIETSDVDSSDKEDGSGLCDDCVSEYHDIFKHNQELGLLWATVRVELATYRRVALSDKWTSPYIDLKAILTGLQTDSAPDIQLVSRNMMKPSCRCGAFLPEDCDHCIRPSVACEFYFSNIEDWSRSSFLEIPHRQWWDGWPVEYWPSNTATTSSENHNATVPDRGPSTSTTQTHNSYQAGSIPPTSGQTAEITDQPMEDQFTDELEVNRQPPPQAMDIDRPDSYDAISPSLITNLEDQQMLLNMYGDDLNMYGSG